VLVIINLGKQCWTWHERRDWAGAGAAAPMLALALGWCLLMLPCFMHEQGKTRDWHDSCCTVIRGLRQLNCRCGV